MVSQTAPAPTTNYAFVGSLADVNGNGSPDLFVQAFTALSIVVDPRTATTAQLAAPTPITACGEHAIGNVNGDPFPDLVVASVSALFILLGNGNGTFQVPIQVATLGSIGPVGSSGVAGPMERALNITDINGDGLDDVVVAGASGLGAWVNTGTAWTNVWSFPYTTLSLSPLVMPGRYVQFADWNGDGRKDLALGMSLPPIQTQIFVWYGVAGGFTTTPAVLVTPAPATSSETIGCGDVDGDGFADIIVMTYGPGTFGPVLFVRYGSPAGPGAPVAIPSTSSSIYGGETDVVDVDADGNNDIVVQGFGYPASVLVRNAGNRSLIYAPFGPPVAAGNAGGGLLIFADMDGDGDPDAASVPGIGNYFTVLDDTALLASGCAGAGGVPVFPIGCAARGNANFQLGVASAAANATAVLGVSTAYAPLTGCGVGPVFSPATTVLPTPTLGVFTTSATGSASLAFALPNVPAIPTVRVYAQWAVADASGTFTAGATNWSLTKVRTIDVF